MTRLTFLRHALGAALLPALPASRARSSPRRPPPRPPASRRR
jgi:hypothetical protein